MLRAELVVGAALRDAEPELPRRARAPSAWRSAQRVVSSTARSSSVARRVGRRADVQAHRDVRAEPALDLGHALGREPCRRNRRRPSGRSRRRRRARAIVSRSEKTWKPPESVRIGPSQPDEGVQPAELCDSPRRAGSAGGRCCRARRAAPSARTSSGWSAFTVAFVPTGMKAGVGIVSVRGLRTPARAAPSER